jgi:hypothetical protein
LAKLLCGLGKLGHQPDPAWLQVSLCELPPCKLPAHASARTYVQAAVTAALGSSHQEALGTWSTVSLLQV